MLRLLFLVAFTNGSVQLHIRVFRLFSADDRVDELTIAIMLQDLFMIIIGVFLYKSVTDSSSSPSRKVWILGLGMENKLTSYLFLKFCLLIDVKDEEQRTLRGSTYLNRTSFSEQNFKLWSEWWMCRFGPDLVPPVPAFQEEVLWGGKH